MSKSQRKPIFKKSKPIAEPLEDRCLLSSPGTSWPLAFDDEFNGTSVDYSKWSNYLPWTNSVSGDNRYHATNNAYASYMEPQDVSESGGSIQLSTAQGNYYGTNGQWFGYSEMMLTTNATFNFQFGYAEVRAQMPTGAGNWPAFWSLGNGWPPENDIMEAGPGAGINHQGVYDMSGTWQNANPQPAVPAAGTWHTYGMEWGPGYEKFNEDGIQTLSVTSNVPAQSMYFLLNSGVATASDANYSNSNNNVLSVDYMRVYGYNATASPQIADSSFDSTTLTTGFAAPTGTGILGGASSRTGNRDLIVNSTSLTSGQTGGASQTVTGLSPNTTYTFSGYGHYYTSGQYGQIGVSGYGGSALTSSFTTAAYSQSAVTFTTGSTNTSASVYLTSSATAPTYFDDTNFEVAPTVSAISNVFTSTGTSTSVPLTVNTGGSGSGWTLAATSSNTTLVPSANVTISGTQLTLQPVAGQTGSSTISVNITDMFGSSFTRTFVLNVANGVTLTGDSNADVFRLVRSGTFLNVFFNNTTTTPDYQYTYAGMGPLTINGGTGSDQILLDYSGGDPVPGYGVSYIGGSGTNSVATTNITTNQAATIKSGSLVMGSDTVTFTNTQSLALDLGSGLSTLLSTTPVLTSVLNLTVDAGSGLTLSSSSTLPTNSIVNVGGTLTLANQNESIDQLTGSGTVSTGTATQLTLGANGGSSTFSGSITGSASLQKVGAGVITLSGINTFTGAVNIGSGSTNNGNANVNGALCITTASALQGTTQVNFLDSNSNYSTLQLNGSSINLPATLSFSVNANTAGASGTAAVDIDSIAGTNTIAGAFTFNVGGTGYRMQVDSGSLAFTHAWASTSHVLYLSGAGSGSFTAAMGGTAAVTTTGSGSWTLAGVETYSGATNISAGTFIVPSGDSLASTSITVGTGATMIVNGNLSSGTILTVNGTTNFGPGTSSSILVRTLAGLPIGVNGVVTVGAATNHAYRTLLVASGLTFGSFLSKLDLNNNDLDAPGATIGTFVTLVTRGFNAAGANWGGAGITSTSAATDSSHLKGLGVISNNNSGGQLYGTSGTNALGQFDGINPGINDVLVKYTYYGDTNLSGNVDGSDYSKIDSAFISGATGWVNGNFNYDSAINGSDYTLIDNAFNSQGLSLSVASEIAQPLSTTSRASGRSNGLTLAPVVSKSLFASTPIVADSDAIDRLVKGYKFETLLGQAQVAI